MSIYGTKGQAQAPFWAANQAGDGNQLDALSVFDSESIGKEFAENSLETLRTTSRSRQAELRRSQLAMESWRDTAAYHKDSSRIPKLSMEASRTYDVKKVEQQSAAGKWVAGAACVVAGIMIALLICQLTLK